MKRWFVPGLTAGVGLGVAIALHLDGRTRSAWTALAVLLGYALLLAIRRHEPALSLSEAFGSGHRARSHLRAAAMTGDVLTMGVVAGLVVQALRDGTVEPYAWLAALAGATYAFSLLVAGRGQ